MPPPWYEQQFNKQARGAFDVNGSSDGKGGRGKSQEPDNNVMPEATKVSEDLLYHARRKY